MIEVTWPHALSKFEPRTAAEEEMVRRYLGEQLKAYVKYGAESIGPKGNTSLDSLDYAINEVVGLIRYGELIINRAGEAPKGVLRVKMYALGRRVHEFGLHNAPALIEVHQALTAAGVVLGRREQR